MSSSPFARGGAVKTKTESPSSGGDPMQAAVAGGNKPAGSTGGDPFSAKAPRGVSGYKALHFMDQLVLMHTSEAGSMPTSSSTPEKPESAFIRCDFIPLSAPNEFEFVNGQGSVETCEPYTPGEKVSDVLVFNTALVNEGQRMLRDGTSWILGRITKGSAKKGRTAPIIIAEADSEDNEIYANWCEHEKAKRG